MTDENEVELVKQAARGDAGAFTSLFERYFQSVYNYALSLSRDPATAEDLTQEAFIKAHTHLPGFKPPWNFRSWIFRMTRNLFLDLIRSRHQADSLDDLTPIAASGPGPEGRAVNSEAARRVRRTLDGLSIKNREVLVLREVHELSYAEIAEVLDTTEAYVKTLLARSRAQFQDAYGIQLLVEEPTEDCPEVAALLQTLHDGESLAGREKFVRDHLESCEACQRRRSWLVAQSGLLAAFVPVLPPAGLADRILAQIGLLGSAPKPSQGPDLMNALRGPLMIGAAAVSAVSLIVIAAVAALTLWGPTQAVQAPAAATASPVPSSTPAPSGTPSPALTATLTLTPVPVFSDPTGEFTQNANCRKGPGTAYNVVTSLLQGQTVPIEGRNDPSTWWWILLPSGGNCWVSGVTVDVAGPVEDVPVVPVPPPPPVDLQANVSCSSAAYSVSLTWFDAAGDESGYRVFRDGRRVASLGADATGYTENIPGGGPHTYSVESFNPTGVSDRAAVDAPCP